MQCIHTQMRASLLRLWRACIAIAPADQQTTRFFHAVGVCVFFPLRCVVYPFIRMPSKSIGFHLEEMYTLIYFVFIGARNVWTVLLCARLIVTSWPLGDASARRSYRAMFCAISSERISSHRVCACEARLGQAYKSRMVCVWSAGALWMKIYTNIYMHVRTHRWAMGEN